MIFYDGFKHDLLMLMASNRVAADVDVCKEIFINYVQD